MAQERLPMRKVREVLRLKAAGLGKRKIAASLGISATAAGACLRRAREAGIAWAQAEETTEEALEARLYPASVALAQLAARRPQPNFAAIHRELKRAGVTLELLWQDYRDQFPDGYSYSQFCELYRNWKKRVSPTMRQTHVAGERVFVDYAGTKPEIVDSTTGEILTAELFVAVLGASSYTFAEATWTQSLSDWIGSHRRALAFFGRVPAMVVSDNLKSGITKACFYEPNINLTYRDMAQHYGTVIIPARPRKPRDKAKVEVGVQVATRWVIAKLRKRTFFSLTELNAAISELVEQINVRVTRHLGASRRSLFEEIEYPALKPLPAEPYEFAEWKKCRPGLDYHVEIDNHYYSVPFALIGQEMWARYTTQTVEVFHRDKRIAVHIRSYVKRGHTTLPEHMPSSHRRYRDWTLERIKQEANAIGPHTLVLVEVILRERPHPEQGFRSCRGIITLAGSYGRERLEAACERALAIGARSYTNVKSILTTRLDRKRPEQAADGPAIAHDNIRGGGYYH
jgi:transposase